MGEFEWRFVAPDANRINSRARFHSETVRGAAQFPSRNRAPRSLRDCYEVSDYCPAHVINYEKQYSPIKINGFARLLK